jgi:hypothetical protein
MTRTVNITLTGLARGGELLAVVTLATIKPRCIEYSLASVTVDVDGCQVSCQSQGITETSALQSIAQWLIKTFGAKAAAVSRNQPSDVRAAA